MTLFLRNEDVEQTVSMDDMLEAIESMQRHYGCGEAFNLGRRKTIAPEGTLSVTGGGLYYTGLLGVKTYTVVKQVAWAVGVLRTRFQPGSKTCTLSLAAKCRRWHR